MALQSFLVSDSGLRDRALANRDLALQNQFAIFGDPVLASLENSTAVIGGNDPLTWALEEAGRGQHRLYDGPTFQQILEWMETMSSANPVGATVSAAQSAGKEAAKAVSEGLTGGRGIVDVLLQFLSEHFLLVVIGLILLGGGLLMIVFDNKETVVKLAKAAI